MNPKRDQRRTELAEDARTGRLPADPARAQKIRMVAKLAAVARREAGVDELLETVPGEDEDLTPAQLEWAADLEAVWRERRLPEDPRRRRVLKALLHVVGQQLSAARPN